MRGLSHKLKGYTGGNPFQESQARTYGDDKVAAEFFPTAFFWDLFNEQHEILLGTRGSGKTILLRMLTFSCLRRCDHKQAKKYVNAKTFLGFYVPLHLEFITSLADREESEREKLLYFQLAFNCIAAKALLAQVAELLADIERDPRARLQREAHIVEHIAPMWCGGDSRAQQMSMLRDLEWYVDLLYNSMDSIDSKRLEDIGQFSRHLLSPIVNVLPRLTDDLGLDRQKTNWVACIDEAEFLPPTFLKCINTFLRSEKRPLVVKMATLPFKHFTRDTLLDGVSIEPDGNDFNYRIIDMDWDSPDFTGLSNHICRVRLSRCGIDDPELTLEKFLGVVGQDDDMVDYFRAELGDEATEDAILRGILESVSPRRRERLEAEPEKARGKAYLNKFAPVYFMRRMRHEDAKGARVPGWFAGAKMVRRIADGNPRRFIQMMNALVEQARAGELDPKDQHRVLTQFCKTIHGESEALQKYGLMLHGLINQIGRMLSDRVHGKEMVSGGCNFRLDSSLIGNTLIISALKLAVDFLHMRIHPNSLLHGIDEHSDFRLCYVYGVEYWLPMRKGDTFALRSTTKQQDLSPTLGAPVTRREAKAVLDRIQLRLLDETGN
jgi:hypothetical protein